MSKQLFSKDDALQYDRQDPLARFREEFYLQPGKIYLDGNSLGLLSKRAEKSLLQALASWRENGIDGWTEGLHPWFYAAEKVGAMTAPLLGATPSEVIATGSTTSNLHQLMATFYKPVVGKSKVLADALNFPSDIYALQSQIALHDLDPHEHLIRVESRDGLTLSEEELIGAMSDDVAIAVLPSVLYRSGQLLDMERLTAAAHEKHIIIGFDVSHSIGAIPHELARWNVDFAFWCNYKYLNGGPGAVGGLFVHHKHLPQVPGLAGWFSSNKESQFDMSHHLTAAIDAGAFQMGTPHMLSMAPLIGSLELFEEATMPALRLKSLQLTRFMMDLIESELAGMNITIANPTLDQRRGGHISLLHEEAVRIGKALKNRDVIPDFRPPNIIRLAPMALYTSFLDVFEAVHRLKEIMVNKEYTHFEKKRSVVS
ncbi:MAG: kynureninase [Acidibacillus sp.]|nr:kynureninase [Acidibacillus sp.]